MSFPSKSEYESLVYGLLDTYPEVITSTLRLYSVSALLVIVEGSVHLRNALELRVVEVLNFKSGRIQRYSYTVLCAGERIRWYDSEPHPENPELASTFPHHRHEPPDIKHNRRPAPGISFDEPNLATLIADCIELGAALAGEQSA
ncbi:MAG: hypothetical protein CVU38_10900 [Chloroflexi bacterium HGW-Chloroflexi-1]|nr:MAG: hypothetical protein CVU38_10900 [Chloroflexi bacterium HGW-Chloroflexi-1]